MLNHDVLGHPFDTNIDSEKQVGLNDHNTTFIESMMTGEPLRDNFDPEEISRRKEYIHSNGLTSLDGANDDSVLYSHIASKDKVFDELNQRQDQTSEAGRDQSPKAQRKNCKNVVYW